MDRAMKRERRKEVLKKEEKDVSKEGVRRDR